MYIPRSTDHATSGAVYQGSGDLYAHSVLWVIAAFVVVVSRIATRVYIVKAPGIDDALIVVAVLASMGMSVSMVKQIDYGMNTPKARTELVQQAFWASVWTYNLSLTFTKVSILVSYFRIFFQQQLRMLCWCILAFCVLFGSWTILGSVFVCVPVSKAWTTMKIYGSPYCQNRYVAWFINASVNMVIDLVLIILPMPILKGLNMPRRQKIALMFVFALGGFVCVMSAIRLYFLVNMSETNDNKNTAVWSVIETNVGIICASLPSLKALVAWIWPKFGNSSYRSSARSGNRIRGPGLPGAEPGDDAAFAKSLGLKAFNTHTTRVQGGHDETNRVWNKKDRFIVLQKDVKLSTMSSSQSGLTASTPPSPDCEIAVQTVLEQEIEEMSDEGRNSTSICDHSSQRDLFPSDSAHDDARTKSMV